MILPTGSPSPPARHAATDQRQAPALAGAIQGGGADAEQVRKKAAEAHSKAVAWTRLQKLVDSAINRVLPELHGRARHIPPKPQMPVRWIIPASQTKQSSNMNTMISAGRIAASTAAWTASPAVMALIDDEWGVLAGLHFAGDDVLLANLSPRVVAAYLSDPDVTRPPAEMPRLMLRVTRCADPVAWYADKAGGLVKFVCAGVGCRMARDDAGTLQRIALDDADLVEVRDGVVSSIVS